MRVSIVLATKNTSLLSKKLERFPIRRSFEERSFKYQNYESVNDAVLYVWHLLDSNHTFPLNAKFQTVLNKKEAQINFFRYELGCSSSSSFI